MLKTLILVRHAKSTWSNPLHTDFERTLNDRGRHDAPEMAQRLRRRGFVPDRMLTSTAVRALETAALLREGLGLTEDRMVQDKRFYHCPADGFPDLIASLGGNADVLMVVAHNPGITDYANRLIRTLRLDNMPTCGMVAVQADISGWDGFADADKQFLFFDSPKNEHQ